MTSPGASGGASAGAQALLRREWPLALAALALVLALLLPPLDAPRPVHRYQVTFDLSQSMEVADMALDGASVSRLAFAKAAAVHLLGTLPCGSGLGWSAFVERRTLTLATPLEVCAHHDALLASLDVIDGRMRWGQASGIGKGLHQGLRAANAIGEGTALVMISDGQEAPPLKPGQSGLPKSEELGVRGLLAGVGGDLSVPIPKTDAEGRFIGHWRAEEVVQRTGDEAATSREELSRLDGEHLASLARLAGLGYARLERPVDLWRALEAAGVAETAVVPTDFRRVPAGLALLLLCWRFRPSWGARGVRRARRAVSSGYWR